jgi:electron transfer flavoprotein alpha/beta subunit
MRRVAVILGSLRTVDPGASPDSPPVLPRSDRAAIALALKLRRFGGPVDAYCLWDDEEALRYALAAGAARGTRLHNIAALEFDLALIGGGGAGPWGDLVPALLAERRECAMVFDVLDVEPHEEGLTVTRDLGRGSREVLAVTGPAVLGVAEDATRSLYISRHRRQAVPRSRLSLGAGPSVDPPALSRGPWERARPRVKTGDLAERTGGSASSRMSALFGISASPSNEEEKRGQLIVDDPATCAQHLLRFLSHHGLIDRSIPEPAPVEGQLHREPSPEREESPMERPRRPARGPRPVGPPAPTRARGPRTVDRDPQPDE